MADNEHDDIYYSASNSRNGDSPGPAGVNDPQGIPADVVRPVQHAEDNNVCFVFFLRRVTAQNMIVGCMWIVKNKRLDGTCTKV